MSCRSTNLALPVACWRPIRGLDGVQMPSPAMCVGFFVWCHGQTFVKYTSSRIKQFLERLNLLSSGNDGVSFHASHFSQFMGRISHAFNDKKHRISTVQHLRFSGNPSAIVGSIRTVVINTVNGHIFRPITHVLVKLKKATLPFVANGNASTSVIRIGRIGRIKASSFDADPYFVGRGPAETMNLVFHARTVPIIN